MSKLERKYLVKRITRTDKDGNKEVKPVCIEVDDIEKFRKRQKGVNFVSVELIYEQIK